MERNAKLILGLVIGMLFVLLIGFYAYAQSKQFLNGPLITISSPINGSLVTESPIIISGTVENIAFISLNDRPIFVDKSGNFSEKLLPLLGYNILTIKAEDRFGKSIKKEIKVVFKPQTSDNYSSTTPVFN